MLNQAHIPKDNADTQWLAFGLTVSPPKSAPKLVQGKHPQLTPITHRQNNDPQPTKEPTMAPQISN